MAAKVIISPNFVTFQLSALFTNLRGKLFEFTYKQQVNMQHDKAKDYYYQHEIDDRSELKQDMN